MPGPPIQPNRKKKNVDVPVSFVHYQLSCFLAQEVEALQSSCEMSEAMTGSRSDPRAFGAEPPEETPPTRHADTSANVGYPSDMEHLDAKPLEQQAEQLSPSAPQITTKKTTSQDSISRRKKQNQRAFLHMCRTAPDDLPYIAFTQHAGTLDAKTSQDMRQLAVIDLKDCAVQQLPLTNSQLFKVLQKNAEKRRITTQGDSALQTELEYIQEAQRRLYEFAIHEANAYAGIRFLSMQQRDAQAVQTATQKMVHDLLKLMNDNQLERVWPTWHPHRLAAVAAYAHLYLDDPATTTSRWNCMVEPKRIYIPIDQIQSEQRLASQGPPSPAMLGVDAVPPRVEGGDAASPRVLDAAGQALATPPVVCELCHIGFRCKEDLINHCNCIHGGFVEYRKHVFWKAETHGLYPLQWWQKRNILSSHAFFNRYSIPGSGEQNFIKNVGRWRKTRVPPLPLP